MAETENFRKQTSDSDSASKVTCYMVFSYSELHFQGFQKFNHFFSKNFRKQPSQVIFSPEGNLLWIPHAFSHKKKRFRKQTQLCVWD